MKEHSTFTAIPTTVLKAEALASMSASFERFCLAAGCYSACNFDPHMRGIGVQNAD